MLDVGDAGRLGCAGALASAGATRGASDETVTERDLVGIEDVAEARSDCWTPAESAGGDSGELKSLLGADSLAMEDCFEGTSPGAVGVGEPGTPLEVP